MKDHKSRWGWLALAVVLAGCGSTTASLPAGGDGGSPDGGSTSTDAGVADGGVADGGGTLIDGGGAATDGGGIIVVSDGGVLITEDGGFSWVCRVTACAGHVTACGDCLDNDGDGRIDERDPDCLGPCDNTEGPGLSSGVGGVGGNTCRNDCYFDFGNGPGNDQCRWDHRCDPLQPEGSLCPYTPSMVGTRDCPAVQDADCARICTPYTPNGCDCFGCCTFPQLNGRGPDGGPGYVWIGALNASNVSTCTLATVDQPANCPPCTPVGNCLNDCGPCEVCLGRPVPPPECFPDAGPPVDGGVPADGGASSDGGVPADGGTPADAGIPADGGVRDAGPTQCAPLVQPCGLPGQAQCPDFYYCITGCCRPG